MNGGRRLGKRLPSRSERTERAAAALFVLGEVARRNFPDRYERWSALNRAFLVLAGREKAPQRYTALILAEVDR